MGEDAEETLTSNNITEVDRKVYAKVIEMLDEFFEVWMNIIFYHARFNLRCQGEEESIEQFSRIVWIWCTERQAY